MSQPQSSVSIKQREYLRKSTEAMRLYLRGYEGVLQANTIQDSHLCKLLLESSILTCNESVKQLVQICSELKAAQTIHNLKELQEDVTARKTEIETLNTESKTTIEGLRSEIEEMSRQLEESKRTVHPYVYMLLEEGKL